VISGELLIQLVDIGSGEKWDVIIKQGQKVRIHPMCAHRFFAIKDSQVIEYYDSPYDPEDDIKFNF